MIWHESRCISHLFENFVRSEKNTNTNKLELGLGLSITKKLGDKLGDSISCETKVGGDNIKH